MVQVFVIKNQDNMVLEKGGEWVHYQEAKNPFRTAHKDEAINEKVELAVKNPELRLQLLGCDTNEKGLPVFDAKQFDANTANDSRFCNPLENEADHISEQISDHTEHEHHLDEQVEAMKPETGDDNPNQDSLF